MDVGRLLKTTAEKHKKMGISTQANSSVINNLNSCCWEKKSYGKVVDIILVLTGPLVFSFSLFRQ